MSSGQYETGEQCGVGRGASADQESTRDQTVCRTDLMPEYLYGNGTKKGAGPWMSTICSILSDFLLIATEKS